MDEVQPSATLGGIIEKKKKGKKVSFFSCTLKTFEILVFNSIPSPNMFIYSIPCI